MAFVSDNVLDNGLSYITTNGTRVDVCSQEPTTYAEATSTYTLGNDTITTGSPTDASPNGRKVSTSAVTSGTVTATGTATHFAITDGSSVLIATGSLTSSQVLNSGNTFSLSVVNIRIPDAAT